MPSEVSVGRLAALGLCFLAAREQQGCRAVSEVRSQWRWSQGLVCSAVCISEGDIFKQYECCLANSKKVV